MPKLSVVIITFNEERNIASCLDSIQAVADDIVVLDSFSTDKTASICQQYPLNFIQRKWEGYSATKNFANTQAKFDWILSIDADEVLSEQLKQSILKAKEQSELCTYKFNRLTNYCGQFIKHCGWYPDTKVRIFDRRTVRWEGLIHEQLTVPDKSAQLLMGDCLHYSYHSIDQHKQQTEKFTTLSANDLFAKGKRSGFLKLYISPLTKFIQSYFFQLGILDGYYGFVICKLSAYSTYLKYFKLQQLYKR